MIETKNKDSIKYSRNKGYILRNLRNWLLDEASYIDKLINKFTVLPFLLLIALSPFATLYLLMTLPYPLNTILALLAFIGFSFTFDIRKNR